MAHTRPKVVTEELPFLDALQRDLYTIETDLLRLLTTTPLPTDEIEYRLNVFDRNINRIPNECSETANVWMRKLHYMRNRYKRTLTAGQVNAAADGNSSNNNSNAPIKTVPEQEFTKSKTPPPQALPCPLKPISVKPPTPPPTASLVSFNVNQLRAHLESTTSRVFTLAATLPPMSPHQQQQLMDSLLTRTTVYAAELTALLEAMASQLKSPSVEQELADLEAKLKLSLTTAGDVGAVEGQLQRFMELCQLDEMTETAWPEKASEVMSMYLASSGAINDLTRPPAAAIVERPKLEDKLKELEARLKTALTQGPIPPNMESQFERFMELCQSTELDGTDWANRSSEMMNLYLKASGALEASTPPPHPAIPSTTTPSHQGTSKSTLTTSSPHYEPDNLEAQLIDLESSIMTKLTKRPIESEELETALGQLVSLIGEIPAGNNKTTQALVKQWNEKLGVLMSAFAMAGEEEKGEAAITDWTKTDTIVRSNSMEQLRQFLT